MRVEMTPEERRALEVGQAELLLLTKISGFALQPEITVNEIREFLSECLEETSEKMMKAMGLEEGFNEIRDLISKTFT